MPKMPHWPIPKGGRFVLGLETMMAALDRLSSPHLGLPPVIHVAGTNGKGSVCANLSSMFKAAGYRWHRYTSPHLLEFNERIVLDGQEVGDRQLHQALEECRVKCSAVPLSFFEGTTAAALLLFSRQAADVLIMEVGMGGRLDATNVVEKPAMTVITTISFDHTEYLGTTLAAIAGEKAGIIKAGAPCVISWQHDEAMAVLREKCAELAAPCLAWGEHWVFRRLDDGGLAVRIVCPLSYVAGKEVVAAEGAAEEVGVSAVAVTGVAMETRQIEGDLLMVELILPQPGLCGIHQYVNAAASAVAAWWLGNREKGGYERLDAGSIAEGLFSSVWPGRMQQIKNGVLGQLIPKHSELWLDGAHNPAGAEMLSSTMADMYPPLPLYVINGRTMQRDIKGFLRYFDGRVTMICGVRVVSEPSGETAENIRDAALEMGFRAVAAESLLEAVRLCLADAGGLPCRILVCGSLYLAGDVLAANREASG